MDRSSFFSRLKKTAGITNDFLGGTDPRMVAAENKSTFSALIKMGATIQGNPFSDYALTKINRGATGSLNPFNGPITYSLVSHLVKRTCFNASIPDIKALMGLGSWSAIFQKLFDTSLPIPPPPTNPKEIQPVSTQPNYNPTGDFIGVASPYTSDLDKQRTALVYTQWNQLIVQNPINIRERMVVFLSSLLVEQEGTIGDIRFFYGYLNLLRNYALGNYKTLVKKLTIDPGMLVYLNGAGSTAKAPNENYGRELQELFTIGKGPQTSTGDYTNYSEKDVQAAAKVLTGWDVTAYKAAGLVGSVFNAANHDTTDKKFSADYGNAVIKNNGNLEYGDLVDLIFNQNATAIYIATRIYREFVYYYIDPNTQTNIIIPLANTLRSNNYELLPTLKQLIQSEHFFDALNIGCDIKDPITFTAGIFRDLGVQNTATAPNAIGPAAGLSMNLGNPDQVAGWKATYESPDFSEWWINSITMENRTAFSDSIIQNNGPALVNIVQNYVSQPGDPNILITELAGFFFPSGLTADYPGPITAKQHDFLKGILLPGLPDFEWAAQIWGPYTSNPDPKGAAYITLVGRLTGLFKFMFSMAEYHLS